LRKQPQRTGTGLVHFVPAVVPGPYVLLRGTETRTKNKNHSVNSGSFLLQRQRLTLCWKILYQAACLGEFLGQWIESRMMNDSVKENSRFYLTWEKGSIMKGREIGRKKKTSLRDFFLMNPGGIQTFWTLPEESFKWTWNFYLKI